MRGQMGGQAPRVVESNPAMIEFLGREMRPG